MGDRLCALLRGFLQVRKSAVDAYHKDRRASDTHQALRCLRYVC